MIILSTVIALLIAGIILDYNVRLRRLKRDITSQWGKVKTAYTNMDITRSFNAHHTYKSSQRLSAQSLKDMDVDSLFGYLDRTNSGIGMQVLYSRICQPSLDVVNLWKLTEAVNVFQDNKTLREKTQLLLCSMEKAGTSAIADLFGSDTTHHPSKHQPILRSLTILAILSIPIFIWLPGLLTLITMIVILGLNLNMHFLHRHRNRAALQTIRQVFNLKKYSARLSRVSPPVDSDQIQTAHSSLSRFRTMYLFLDLGIPTNDISAIAYYVIDLLRGIFLVEVHLLDYTYSEMIRQTSSIKDLFIYAGEVDCALSIASLKATENLLTCRPDFLSTPKLIHITNAIHPLIANCHPNSIFLNNSSALITGSNMSGKSTFLRMLMINVVVARSLNFCFATQARLSMTNLFSSITIADDLSDNKSYYLQEVAVIHEMIMQSKSGSQNIFIIDEIFKGTNTKERIALANAILHYLDKSNNLVIATSHDVQLTQLTSDSYRQFHFAEKVEADGIKFDFTIHDGPSGVGNAIKLVEAVGYPAELVHAARMGLEKQ